MTCDKCVNVSKDKRLFNLFLRLLMKLCAKDMLMKGEGFKGQTLFNLFPGLRGQLKKNLLFAFFIKSAEVDVAFNNTNVNYSWSISFCLKMKE